MTPWRLYITVFLIISFSFRLIRLVTAIRKARGEGHGITTARPIFWVMTGSYLLFFGIGGWEALRQPMPQEWGISLFGLLLYVSALLLRERAMFDLGRFFSPDI